ncbi:MAG: glycosyltransferase family 87 protein [Caulobacterales bacterium]
MLWLLALGLAATVALMAWRMLGAQPLGVDFLPLWTAGGMAWTAPDQVYDFAAVTRPQTWLLPHLRELRPYPYPPSLLLLLAPLGRLPFWAAYKLWMLLGVGVFGLAGARLAQRQRGLALALMLLTPAAMIAALVGQSVFLICGLVVLAMLELERRPWLAGVLLALAGAIKPQAVVLAPVALLAARQYRAIAGATIAGSLILVVSALAFGPQLWLSWAGALPRFQALIQAHPRMMERMITPSAFGGALGLSGPADLVWRGMFVAVAVALAWHGFRVSRDAALRTALLSGGALLMSPYAVHYEFVMLAPAAVAAAVNKLDDGVWWPAFVAYLAVALLPMPQWSAVALVAFVALSAVQVFDGPASWRRLAVMARPGINPS